MNYPTMAGLNHGTIPLQLEDWLDRLDSFQRLDCSLGEVESGQRAYLYLILTNSNLVTHDP